MDHQSQSDWKASWIWGIGQESPRNEWRCFRRSFTPETYVKQAKLRITADSRYVLYVGGKLIGRGPVRSWPTELAYDEYEIGHLMSSGVETVVSVLVLHYGLSTFQYLRGRGGLLLEVKGVGGSDESSMLATDSAWKTSIHKGYNSTSSRMSCQLGFTEIVDARDWDNAWTEPCYDDSEWEAAAVIGPVGMQPWTKLVKRPIPYLTEEPIYPDRVEAFSAVKPAAWSAVFDLRGIMMPESADHANNVQFSGFFAAIIQLDQAATFTIGIVDDGRCKSAISLDGQWYELDNYVGEAPERYLTVDLQSGEHFLLIDVTCVTHGHGFHLGFDAAGTKFDVLPPVAVNDGFAPFVAIGPFDKLEIIDNQPGRKLIIDHPDYESIRNVSSSEGLKPHLAWIRPVDPQLFNRNDVFTSNVWKTTERAMSVPSALQHAVIPGPDSAEIPVFAGLDSELVIDFGRELSGYVAFELDAASGTVIDGYGLEYMKDGWRQHTYLLDNTFRYTCREGRQSYVSFVRRGLRYLTLTVRGAARPAKVYEVKLLQSNYPLANVGRFRSSDPLLNDIWLISRDTTRLCMEDTFVDCPAFEQVYWVGDARNEALVNYYTFGAREIVEHCLKLVTGSSYQTPLYSDQVPSGWNSVIPNWTFFWIAACREYYQFDGKLVFLTDIWLHIKHTLKHYLVLLNDQGLFEREGWNLLDWAPFEQPREGIVTPQNMFLVRALRHGAEIGTLVGDHTSAGELLEEADKLRASIDRLLWNEEREAYLDCIRSDGSPSSTVSMQTQIVAYLCDIPSEARMSRLEEYIVSPPESFVQVGSPFMSFFYYEALAKVKRLDIMLKDIRNNYGFMIENDATTCWEMYPWSGYNENPKMLTRSHCHAWSAGPSYFFGAYVLGVQGLTPGWSKVRISPQPSGLKWANGTVPLAHNGRIDVSWRILEKDRLHLRVEAPRQVEIIADAPEGYEMTVEHIYLE
ncbi:family 78 glycoside hydrolase catalytic domain [Cohnella sp.]|uniref:family 78 glycoside hydrolase catalytic domain n=1 Tax=Cohnella sp. TaxID=1883426 RepID=UPI0035622AC2